MNTPPITLDTFREKILRLPVEQQVVLIQELFDAIYAGTDDKVFRVMATAIKNAKEAKLEGHENFRIEKKDLTRLTHIQDKNRFEKNKK